MANESNYSSFITLAAAVDAGIVPMFTSQVIMAGLVSPHTVGMPNTRVKDLPKSGTITASVTSENTAITSQTLSDSKVTLTLQKAAVLIRPSIEAVKFASAANPGRLTSLSAQACAKKYDADACAILNSFTQTVDSGAVMTVSSVLQAAYLVRAGNIPSQRIAAVLSYKQSFQVGDNIRNSTGSFYGNPNYQPDRAVNGGMQVPGFLGNFFGVEWYESGNTTTAQSATKAVGGVFAPEYAIAALYAEGNAPAFETTIADQTEFGASILNVKTLMWYQIALYVDAAGVGLLSLV
jgi:hypothetical protein